MSAAVWSEAHVAECGRRDARRVGGGPWEVRSHACVPTVRTPRRTAKEAIPHVGEPSSAETT
jgi:hypothetical protein